MTAAPETVAFIGLGHMGGPMAANLARAGYDVVGYDVVPEALERAVANGVRVAEGPTQAVEGASTVITMLPSGRHVLEAYGTADGDGLLAAAPAGTLFVDCSTIDVEDARTASDRAVSAGHRGLDAPVSGGVVGAEGGTLTFMVGAPAGDFAAVRPLLDVMGAKVIHCGSTGAGQAAKICNNMILGITMIGVSEAFVLGEKLGLTHEALFDVSANASGQCWALTTNCPVPGPVPTSPANRDYQPGFAGALMAKDLGLALGAIEANGVTAEMGRLASQIYTRYAAGDGARTDFSGIIQEIRAGSTEGAAQ